MVYFVIREGKDDSLAEIHISTKFSQTLTYDQLPKVLEILAQLTQNIDIEGVLLVGITHVNLTVDEIEIKFVFSTDISGLEHLALEDRDFASKMQVKYIFHIFAVIDSNFGLSDKPFPPGYRNFLHFK